MLGCGDVDWGAAATFSAGFMAVGGAVFVGLKQVEMLKRQSALQELSLRHDLFDRRWKVFEAARTFMAYVISEKTLPPIDIQKRFAFAMIESKYLFAEPVQDRMQEILDQSEPYFQTVINAHTGTSKPEDTKIAEDYFEWLDSRINTLSEMFGDELHLGQLTTK
jgi:hypothetical protein